MSIDTEIKEYFKIHPDYTRYEISNLGRIRNIKSQNFLKPSVINKGYLSLELYRDSINRGVTVKLHRIIAETYKNKIKGYVIDHIYDDKTNNGEYNLKYVTNRYNTLKQKIRSKKGFIQEIINKYGKIKYNIEYRKNGRRYNFSSFEKIECIKHYYNAMLDEDISVCELIKQYYQF